jgi:Rieske Fe-S protein
MTQIPLTRRAVLGGAAAVGGAALLAACGGDDDSSADTGNGDDEAGGDDSGGEGDTLVPVADVPVGSGVIVGTAGVVVTQPTDGEFKGFSSTCTHQGCQVSSVDDDTITCSCHNSRFSIEDGSVVGGPAPQPLPEVQVSVSGDQVVRA